MKYFTADKAQENCQQKYSILLADYSARALKILKAGRKREAIKLLSISADITSEFEALPPFDLPFLSQPKTGGMPTGDKD